MYLKETGTVSVDWIHVPQESVQWWTLVNTLMDKVLRV
jgi:hypothetical protein